MFLIPLKCTLQSVKLLKFYVYFSTLKMKKKTLIIVLIMILPLLSIYSIPDANARRFGCSMSPHRASLGAAVLTLKMIIIPTLKMRTWRLREIKEVVPGYTARKGSPGQDQVSLTLESQPLTYNFNIHVTRHGSSPI